MRSTFKILFYANKGKEKDGMVPIMEVNGDKWIIGRRHKTNIPFQVKLM